MLIRKRLFKVNSNGSRGTFSYFVLVFVLLFGVVCLKGYLSHSLSQAADVSFVVTQDED